jgi:hypothetical protein
VHLSWDGSSGRESLDPPVRLALSDEAETVRLLQGSRLITDIEARGVSGETLRVAMTSTPRGTAQTEQALWACVRRFAVAVVRRQGDQLGEIPRRRSYRLVCHRTSSSERILEA